jgi:hypothetical protein
MDKPVAFSLGLERLELESQKTDPSPFSEADSNDTTPLIQPKKRNLKKMTEAGLKSLLQVFFKQNDENQSGAIELGGELDNLMQDVSPYIFGDHLMSRDEKRELFNMSGASKDGKITFDEFFKTIANMYNEEDRFIKPGKSADMSPVKMTKELDIAVQAATKVKAPELKLSDKAGSPFNISSSVTPTKELETAIQMS